MTLAFQRVDNGNDKPDNSETFFSARQPFSNVTGLNGLSLKKPVPAHPYRYFVAAGESLTKITQLVANIGTMNDGLAALAKEVGAESLSNNGYFTFSKPEVEPVPPQVRFRHKQYQAFICDAASLGSFFPDRRTTEGAAVHKEILSFQELLASDPAVAQTALAKKYKAESFDGNFFRFKDWETQIEAIPISQEKKFRLKSNPAFVRCGYSNLFSPDLETDEGNSLIAKAYEIISRQFPERLLAQWINSFTLDISLSGVSESRDRSPIEAEKIGDEWIIKVPLITEGIFGEDGKGGTRTGTKEGWVMPPGAKPIAISEYYAKLEKSGSLQALPTTGKAS